MSVLVTGATGHIGNVLVRESMKTDEKVRVLLLPSEDDLPLRGLNVEIVRGDVCELIHFRRRAKVSTPYITSRA